MLNYLNLKQIGSLKLETIIGLNRFVMKNNYFSYDGQYNHEIRGGARGSPLTLTIANYYTFFFEGNIVKQVHNSDDLYLRYIDDIFHIINWTIRHRFKQIDRCNKIDLNIKLSANISLEANILDQQIETNGGQLYSNIYHKPSYEPYHLLFNSVHPSHMKKNISFAMLLRAIRYCSKFETYLKDIESLRMTLILNKYPGYLIENQFNRLLLKFKIDQALTLNNYKFL